MKKTMSIILSLVMLLGLITVSVHAEESKLTSEEGLKPVSLTFDFPNSQTPQRCYISTTLDLRTFDDKNKDKITTPVACAGYNAITTDAVFTVKHTGEQDDGSYITINMVPYESNGKGQYLHTKSAWGYYLTNKAGFIDNTLNPDTEEYGGVVRVYAGESKEFTLPIDSFHADTVYYVQPKIYYPTHQYSYWWNMYFKVDENGIVQLLEEEYRQSLPSFQDVPEQSYYTDAVTWAIENTITNGTSDTTFSPHQTCTQAQILTFLWRANGSPVVTDGEHPFPDITEAHYFHHAVIWAYTNGMIDDSFSPQDPCTRSTAVTYLYQNAGTPDSIYSGVFEDVTEEHPASAIQWALDEGITTGTTEHTFAPDNPCTRAQIVTFLYRAMADKPTTTPETQ